VLTTAPNTPVSLHDWVTQAHGVAICRVCSLLRRPRTGARVGTVLFRVVAGRWEDLPPDAPCHRPSPQQGDPA